MPTLNSYADVLTDLEKLLAAAEANEEMLPGMEAFKASLQQNIAELRTFAVQRDTLNADKQVLSAGLKESLRRGRDLGVQFRGFVRSHVGMRNEKLVEFRIPVRRLGVSRKPGGTEGAQAARAAKLLAKKAKDPQPAEPAASPAGEASVNGPE